MNIVTTVHVQTVFSFLPGEQNPYCFLAGSFALLVKFPNPLTHAFIHGERIDNYTHLIYATLKDSWDNCMKTFLAKGMTVHLRDRAALSDVT